MENMSKYNYSRKISRIRNKGNVKRAIEIALEAREKYPGENIFEKFLGDLYFQENNYEAAGMAYIEFLKKIDNNVEYVKHFAQFLERYSEVAEDVNGYLEEVKKILDVKIKNQDVVVAICEIISHYIDLPQLALFKNDKKFGDAMSYLREIENTFEIYILFYKVLAIKHNISNRKIDKSVVSSMEKKGRYKEALGLIVEILVYDQDKVAVRTLFRICRKLNDYSEAEKYIDEHPGIKTQREFNILYELVFYYSRIGDIEDRNDALKKIEICGQNSIPIMRTLYNFYLQFGMLDKAMEIKSSITKKQKVRKRANTDRSQQEDDAENALLKAIQELFAELEHSRKLISMSELLKGFSHELGQPITNIRYGVQLFQMKMEKGINTNVELNALLENILSQTYRIKKMLDRFSPITSEKNAEMKFNVVEEINLNYSRNSI
ncbi:MAG: histidine kinase dimerization/phospho-acceptor domain-containing protein [Oscillospiraceae bacterium]|nr:histidine kinase dimerization/phospho-acceptor domain-containing protein [Oscillospiraceae bacterium]